MPWRIDVNDTNFAIRIGSYASVIALVLSAFLVVATLFIRSVPDARHHVDRISWRLFIVAMWLQVIFAATYIVMYADVQLAELLSYNKPACTVGMMLTMGTRQTVSWLIAAIAVNLALTVRWGVHVGRYRLERWYIIGSLCLGYLPVVVGAGLRTFGSSKAYKICYFQSQGNYRRYLLRAFFTYYLGMCASTFVCLVAVIVALNGIFRQARATAHIIRLDAAVSPRPGIGINLPSNACANRLPVPTAAYLASPLSSHNLDVQVDLDDEPVAAARPPLALGIAYTGAKPRGVPTAGLDLELQDPSPLASEVATPDSASGSESEEPVNNVQTTPGLVAEPGKIEHTSGLPTPPTVTKSRYSTRSSFSFSFSRSKAKKRGSSPSDSSTAADIGLTEDASRRTSSGANVSAFRRLSARIRCEERERKISTYSLDDAFLKIALRVSVYPLALILTNVLYISKSPAPVWIWASCDILFYLRLKNLSDSLLPLYFTNAALYAGRGALFALLGILIDPGFSKGLWAAARYTFAKWRGTRQSSATADGNCGPATRGAEAEDDVCSLRDFFGLPPRRNGIDGRASVAATPLESPATLPDMNETLAAAAAAGHADTEQNVVTPLFACGNPFEIATDAVPSARPASNPVSPKTAFCKLRSASISFAMPAPACALRTSDVPPPSRADKRDLGEEGSEEANVSSATEDVFGSSTISG